MDSWAIAGILVLFGVLEAFGGLYHNSKRTKDDWWIEILSFVHASTVSKPLIVLVSGALMLIFLPQMNNQFAETTLWISLPFVLLVDDIIQYWYHRKAHEWKWLWNLHRPHHSGPEMGVMVSFRENVFYVMIIPNIWFLGIVTYLGMGTAVAIALVMKYLVVIGAHSDFRWDRWLYQHKVLSPLAWIIERTISTPATHFAHHAKSSKDGIGNPTGNFSNMFFFWDIIFGTALITRKYPEEFGIENDPKDHWAAHLYWPIIKSDKPNSEIGAGFDRKKTELREPIKMDVSSDQVYWWCSCGYSTDQPFCNGSHNGTKQKPMRVEFEKDKKVSWCTCKATKTPPFCDGSHKSLK
jgi:sterol desaturase/sphingolipid hydroxylase (fatty acid hydroxylase superfamily)/CDGSH-type Zn-finger protein